MCSVKHHVCCTSLLRLAFMCRCSHMFSNLNGCRYMQDMLWDFIFEDLWWSVVAVLVSQQAACPSCDALNYLRTYDRRPKPAAGFCRSTGPEECKPPALFDSIKPPPPHPLFALLETSMHSICVPILDQCCPSPRPGPAVVSCRVVLCRSRGCIAMFALL